MHHGPPLLAEAIKRVRSRPSIPVRPPATPGAPAQDNQAHLVDLLTQGRLLVPANARPVSVGAVYVDPAPAAGTAEVTIATWKVPSGFRFVVRRRIVLLDTTATPTGGVVLKADNAVVHNGATGPEGITLGGNAVGGEFLGASGSDQEFPQEFAPGVTLVLSAILVRGGVAISCSVLAQLVGYLVQEV